MSTVEKFNIFTATISIKPPRSPVIEIRLRTSQSSLSVRMAEHSKAVHGKALWLDGGLEALSPIPGHVPTRTSEVKPK